MTADAASLRDLAAGEREVAEAWLADEDVEEDLRLRCYRSSMCEALRLTVLALHTEGELTALECGTAVLLSESFTGSVDELIAAARAVLLS